MEVSELDKVNERLIANLTTQRNLAVSILRTILAYPQTVEPEQIVEILKAIGEEP